MTESLKNRIRESASAYACGDAIGMPTEFMTLGEIRSKIGTVDRLLPQELSMNHPDLEPGRVTDDTEQNAYLLEAYRKSGEITSENTVEALLRWIDETDAVNRHYIGPNSKKALEAVKAGASMETAGTGGTTCGGIMRIPSVTWFDPGAGDEELSERVLKCLKPTHFTWEALEAAGAYAFAMREALSGGGEEAVLKAARLGGRLCSGLAPWQSAAPSSVGRIEFISEYISKGTHDPRELQDMLYSVIGTGLPSADVCCAVFAIFLTSSGSAWEAVKAGASLGGDTDTIAALAGALTAAASGKNDIPEDIRRKVEAENPAVFSKLRYGIGI
ncbi:MAG: ADP-ribosylglycohydrolase family protein [Oscillospiraceae bacterium]|jgi:ADP-ribosylglycohydrolase